MFFSEFAGNRRKKKRQENWASLNHWWLVYADPCCVWVRALSFLPRNAPPWLPYAFRTCILIGSFLSVAWFLLSPPPAKLSMVQGEPPGWRTPVLSIRCWWMGTAGAAIRPLTRVHLAPDGGHRAGNTMAIQQTGEHMIFIKEQGWFPVCCSRNQGLTPCCSLGFSCCLLSLLIWQSCVLPRNTCSCVLLVPGYGVVLAKIPCRWGRWRGLPETTWTHSAQSH